MTVEEGPPIILDVEDFQYTYKCGHCGHEWTEHRTKEEKEEHHLPAEPFPVRGREMYSDEIWRKSPDTPKEDKETN